MLKYIAVSGKQESYLRNINPRYALFALGAAAIAGIGHFLTAHRHLAGIEIEQFQETLPEAPAVSGTLLPPDRHLGDIDLEQFHEALLKSTAEGDARLFSQFEDPETRFKETGAYTAPPQNVLAVESLSYKKTINDFLCPAHIRPFLDEGAKNDPSLLKELDATLMTHKETRLAYTDPLFPLILTKDFQKHFFHTFNHRSILATFMKTKAVGSINSPYPQTPFPRSLKLLMNAYVRQTLGDQFNLFYYNGKYYAEYRDMSEKVCKLLNRIVCPTLENVIRDPKLLDRSSPDLLLLDLWHGLQLQT